MIARAALEAAVRDADDLAELLDQPKAWPGKRAKAEGAQIEASA